MHVDRWPTCAAAGRCDLFRPGPCPTRPRVFRHVLCAPCVTLSGTPVREAGTRLRRCHATPVSRRVTSHRPSPPPPPTESLLCRLGGYRPVCRAGVPRLVPTRHLSHPTTCDRSPFVVAPPRATLPPPPPPPHVTRLMSVGPGPRQSAQSPHRATRSDGGRPVPFRLRRPDSDR